MWLVEPQPPTDTGSASAFYGHGCYTFLNRDGHVPVYLQEHTHSVYIGLLEDITLPSDFPPITFPEGVTQIVVVPVEMP